MSDRYPKRLIEVDLPIKKISEYARQEKSVRQGHISTLHIWWARRPLAACRAILCASLWPDPADIQCPEIFRSEAARLMKGWRDIWGGKHRNWNDPIELRKALLDFIADFSNWNNANKEQFLNIAQHLIKVAHESMYSEPNGSPLVIDPFAGGGSIPLEAIRLGVDVFAGDLNPIPILLNKVILEYIPKYGQDLITGVEKWGGWVFENARKELEKYYVSRSDNYIPMVYLWARTIKCEGPKCGTEIPLIGELRLGKTGKKITALKYEVDGKAINFKVIEIDSDKYLQTPLAKRFTATCPLCGFTTPYKRVREQINSDNGGSNQARLISVIAIDKYGKRVFRLATSEDETVFRMATAKICTLIESQPYGMSILPNEPLPPNGTIGFRVRNYGMKTWGDLFNHRQALALVTYTNLISDAVY